MDIILENLIAADISIDLMHGVDINVHEASSDREFEKEKKMKLERERAFARR